MSKKRYLRVGFNFDDLRGMKLNEIGNLFTLEFDESFFLIDVRDDISSGHTFFLVESEKLKEVEEGHSIPVLFVQEDREETEDGPEYFYSVPDYNEYLEPVETKSFDTETTPLIFHHDWKSAYEGIFQYESYYKKLLGEFSKVEIDKILYGTAFMKFEPTKIERISPYEVLIYDTKTNESVTLPKETTVDQSKIVADAQVAAMSSGNMKVYNPYTGQMEDYHGGFPGEASDHVGCKHQWKPYMGFSEKYDYCEVDGCKEKRDYSGKES